MSAFAARCRRIAGYLLRDHPGLYLFAAVACLYFATMSREVPWGDARPVYEVALSMVRGDGVSVQTRWPSDAPPGRGGRFYAAQPWLPSLAHLPGAALRATLGRLAPGPEVAHLLDVLSCHLAGGLLGALAAWLFFQLCLRHGATRQVARFAARNRQQRGLGKPETFQFLGFTHICGKSRKGRFQLKRITDSKRLRAKLHALRGELVRRRDRPIPEQGRWLASVLRGHANYYGVPGNHGALYAFRSEVVRLWRSSLRRRSQRTRLTWARMQRLRNRWLPFLQIAHPWPERRFDARTQGRSPVR